MPLAALLFALSLPVQNPPVAQAPKLNFVETFAAGNAGRWSFFGNPDNPIEVIEAAGGNPGAFLHSTCSGLACLDTFAPQLRTELGVPSVFSGDYRSKGVRALGVDLAIFRVDFSSSGRPLTLMLTNDAGTPADPLDDVIVHLLGSRNVPQPDGSWHKYTFQVPSASPTLPAHWQVFQGSGNDDADWNQVITDVDQASFFFGDPQFFFIFQQWELGVDNMRIRLDADGL